MDTIDQDEGRTQVPGGGTVRVTSSHARTLAAGQGLFYAATGVWPLLSRRSFEAVTGRKTDWWLVQTVGVLVSAVGVTLTAAGANGRVGPELRHLAAGSAVGLAAIDVVHASRGRISKVYLLDAAGELALAAAWLTLELADRRSMAGRRGREERRWSGASVATGREQPT
jgi:hypothetical protein